MYGTETDPEQIQNTQDRKLYVSQNPSVTFIPFSYSTIEKKFPFFIKDMRPDLQEIASTHGIDVLVVACSGHSQSPHNTVRSIPIIILNIFGSPTAQPNVVKQIGISKEVTDKVLRVAYTSEVDVFYIPTEEPDNGAIERGRELRKNLHIPESALVFGRIGRADNAIFDPIGINAFEKLVQEYPDTHYVMMAPPPVLRQIVTDKNIPNVHFLEPSAKEDDIWAFHKAIDVLAHFRADGESCGLNIIEAMMASRPVISHKTNMWNAHLEYLDPSFSRVANQHDWQTYHKYMKEFVQLHNKGTLSSLGTEARNKALHMFLFKKKAKEFEHIIDSALAK
jgi:hypothetical protein